MKRKLAAAVLCVSLSMGVLGGCEKTPEDTIIKEKGADSIQKYEEGEVFSGTLWESLHAPKHYQNESVYENGGLIIDTDADVILPEADSVNTYEVVALEGNQDLIDQVTNAFFEGDFIYDALSYHTWTKADYQEQITTLKRYKAEGNFDPYEYGNDENGEPQFQIDEQIAQAEEKLKNAPEEVEKKLVTPALNLTYQSEKFDEPESYGDYFAGVAETENGAYDYSINYLMKPDLTFRISRIRDDVPDPMEFTSWTEGQYIRGEERENYISETKIKSLLNISYEDAKKIAEEKIGKLGLGLSLYDWDYSVFCHGEGGVSEERMLDAGYLFHFSRALDGIPITYTTARGGGLEDMDSTLTPWGYEYCDVIVGDAGIENVEFGNPYAVGEMRTKNVALMDFDEIMAIYEQMMEVSNADIVQYEAERTYHIKKIVFGYGRIYDPTTDNDVGLLVPVWDFFGGFDAKSKDGESSLKNAGEYSTQSFLTINAIDGTVIDRGLGY